MTEGKRLNIFRPADILLPKTDDYTAWSVVACDQFTSEPEYWEKVYERAGEKPSTLRMILPEAELGIKDPEKESEKIYATMKEYLAGDLFSVEKDCLVYVERTLNSGIVRKGIVGAFDLEAYDWHEGTYTPIRATEHTVEDRLPPRVKVREKALLEMPHIMIFMDDPDNIVFSAAEKGKELYDFELMQNGGHIRGWRVADNAAIENAVQQLSSAEELNKKYGTADKPIIFAMGDGNHSIAAAKKYWETVKTTIPESEWDTHPARFALAELINIHDDAIIFEPIHKVVFNTDNAGFISEAESFFADYIGDGKEITLICGEEEKTLHLKDLTLGELIGKCEDFCKAYTDRNGGYIDYIHGDEECVGMAKRPDCAGILLPKMEKSELFTSVMQSGPFPKKSFSIGHGPDKRYYLECRAITK